jgi:hypothetical protein
MKACRGNLGYNMAEIPRQARDTEFYRQIENLSKIRGGNSTSVSRRERQ